MPRKPEAGRVGSGTREAAHPPSMEALLSSPEGVRAAALHGRECLKEELRNAIASGESRGPELLHIASDALDGRFSDTLRPAINATGVLLHTNLGRAPYGESARAAAASAARGYSTLELDTRTGERGRRQDHVRSHACSLFGVEAAIVANNNAAALFLALTALARGRRVLVSRGELVAIGGSFKIPEILESSGASLAEVGTTNRTSADDYRRAVGPDVALLLTVHPSNYEIRGYASRPEPREIAAVAREAGIPWVHDQGTGCVVALDEFGVPGEPTVADCLAQGADLVTFSGDKLLSGPQAGLVVGRGDLVQRLSAHPVARAVRPGKTALAALAATLADWRSGRWREFPVYRAASQTLAALEDRGSALVERIGRRLPALHAEVLPSLALFGGGTSPEKRFPSRALVVSHRDRGPDEILGRLRDRRPPVVGRIEEGRVWLDLRSVAPEEDPELSAAVESLA